MSVTRVPVRTSTPSRSSCRWADADRSGGIGRQHPVHRLDEDDPGVGRVDRPEIAPERVARDLAERARQLDAGRAAADEHERHPLAPPFRIGFALRGLERDEDAPPDLGRILERLEARARSLAQSSWPKYVWCAPVATISVSYAIGAAVGERGPRAGRGRCRRPRRG